MVQKTKYSKELLIENLKDFRFNESISFSDIIQIWKNIDTNYKSFSITAQLKRIYIVPYMVLFYTNDTIIVNPFIEMFEELKRLVKERRPNKKFEDFSPRLIINKNLILMDLFPTSMLRYKHHFYVLSQENVLLDDKSLEELGKHQELELRKLGTTNSDISYTTSKKI